MDRYRIAGEIVSTIHILWILAVSLSSFFAPLFFILGAIAVADPEQGHGLTWLFLRISLCCGAFWLVQGLVLRFAQRIWGDCPMLMLERSLFMRDSPRHKSRLKSGFCDWLARYGVRLSPSVMVFTATMALACSLNLALFAPVVYLLFF